MIQEVIVLIIFLFSIGYLISIFRRNYKKDSGCAKGCGGCNVVDFKGLEKEIAKKEAVKIK